MERFQAEYDIEVHNSDNDIWHDEAFALTKQEADKRIAEIRANNPTVTIRVTEYIIDNERYGVKWDSNGISRF